ncbi:MAG: hypothetical protein FD152_4666 [Xanthobacteraceae bacterium]|nr:MAG: hypothetical protein FD152_4666 [Xanthobacteraceae bacterium]
MGLMNAGGLSLIWPVLAQVALTFVILFVMGYFRRKALQGRCSSTCSRSWRSMSGRPVG